MNKGTTWEICVRKSSPNLFGDPICGLFCQKVSIKYKKKIGKNVGATSIPYDFNISAFSSAYLTLFETCLENLISQYTE